MHTESGLQSGLSENVKFIGTLLFGRTATGERTWARAWALAVKC